MSEKRSKFSSITQIFKFITGIISWVMLVILVLIAAFLLYYFISTRVYASKGESFKPAVSLYTIVTQSMEPNINPYDVIIDATVKNPENIKIGDVITFISTASISRGMTITHRVYDIKQENGEYYYYTKGDNNISPDLVPASYSNVLGKVLIRIPQLGRLQAFLSTKAGWLIVVVIPALFIIISDIVKMFRLGSAKKNVDKQIMTEEIAKKEEELQKEETHQKLLERYNVTESHEKEEVKELETEIKEEITENIQRQEEPQENLHEEKEEKEMEEQTLEEEIHEEISKEDGQEPLVVEKKEPEPIELPKIKAEIELPKEVVQQNTKPTNKPKTTTKKTSSNKKASPKKSTSNKKGSTTKKKTISKNTNNKKKKKK